MPGPITFASYINAFEASSLAPWNSLLPWELVSRSAEIVLDLVRAMPRDGYRVEGDIAVHNTAIVESGAVLKGPLLIGAGGFVAAGAHLRGGCNFRNERDDKEVFVRVEAGLLGTGSDKFGALVGDHSRVGANAVLAPGALLAPGSIVRRASLCDQDLR